MRATRLSNIEKRLERVADRVKAFEDEKQGFVPMRWFIVLSAVGRALPLSVAIWSILELPIELILVQSPAERLASVAGRLVWVAFAFGTICKMRFARTIFLFLCAVSSMVVAQALPMAYQSSALVCSVLVVDLVLKVSALFAAPILTLMTPCSR